MASRLNARFPDEIISITVESQPLEVTSMYGSSEPDPAWSYTDPMGHTHTHERLTWRWVYDGPEFYFDADGDEHNGDGDYRCLVCGAVIEPGTIYKPPSPYKEYIAGPRFFTATFADGHSEPITEERYTQLLDIARTGDYPFTDETGGVDSGHLGNGDAGSGDAPSTATEPSTLDGDEPPLGHDEYATDLLTVSGGDRFFCRPGDGVAMRWEDSGDHSEVLCGVCERPLPFAAFVKYIRRELADREVPVPIDGRIQSWWERVRCKLRHLSRRDWVARHPYMHPGRRRWPPGRSQPRPEDG